MTNSNSINVDSEYFMAEANSHLSRIAAANRRMSFVTVLKSIATVQKI